MNFEQFTAFERAEAERPMAARRRALSLSGAVLALTGLVVIVSFEQISPETAPGLRELRMLGLIPLAIGGALLLHAAASGSSAPVEARQAGAYSRRAPAP